MNPPVRKPQNRPIEDAAVTSGNVVGAWTGVTADGRALVDFPGNCRGPIPARTIVALTSAQAPAPGQSLPVLLTFDGFDPARPIVLGLVRETLADPLSVPARRGETVATFDGRRLELSAEQEIVLRCGQGSITLTADGRIVLRGTHLVSRASHTNKIKGASVAIN